MSMLLTTRRSLLRVAPAAAVPLAELALDCSARGNETDNNPTHDLAITTTVDNVWILLFSVHNSVTVSSVSDTTAATWTAVDDVLSGVTEITCHRALIATAGSLTITVTYNTNCGFSTLCAVGVSGVNVSSPLDLNASNPASDAGGATSITTDADDTFIVNSQVATDGAAEMSGGTLLFSGADGASFFNEITYRIATAPVSSLSCGSGQNMTVALRRAT